MLATLVVRYAHLLVMELSGYSGYSKNRMEMNSAIRYPNTSGHSYCSDIRKYYSGVVRTHSSDIFDNGQLMKCYQEYLGYEWFVAY